MRRILATLVLVLFVSCGFTTVNAATTEAGETERENTITPEESDSLAWSHILHPYKDGDSTYWDYVLNKLVTQYYYQLTDELYKESQEFNYNVVVMVQDDEYFQVLIKDVNGENLITDEDVIRTIVSCSNDAGGLNRWNAIQLNNLDMSCYEEIIKKVEEDGSRSDVYSYEITDITKSEDGNRFSIRIEMTSFFVQDGDTLSEIAERKLTTAEKLVELNPQIKNQDLIYPGCVLQIK